MRRLLALPADKDGRGPMNAHFETLALAALHAGDVTLGADLVERACRMLEGTAVPDERATLRVAQAELLMARGRWAEAAALLQPRAAGRRRACACAACTSTRWPRRTSAWASRRRRCTRCAMWQKLHTERALQASGARYQAAALQTELLRMKQELQSIDARRRSTEQRARRARSRQPAAEAARSPRSKRCSRRCKQQATRDFLTGLFNRRHLDDVLPAMLAMAQRDRQPLSVVIIDLDHFKTVNDQLGHAAGDRLLAAFGELLGTHNRKSDVACRYGGEEFCLLMPRTAAAAARRKTLALLKQWSAQCDGDAQKLPGARSFSAGVADSLAGARRRCTRC